MMVHLFCSAASEQEASRFKSLGQRIGLGFVYDHAARELPAPQMRVAACAGFVCAM